MNTFSSTDVRTTYQQVDNREGGRDVQNRFGTNRALEAPLGEGGAHLRSAHELFREGALRRRSGVGVLTSLRRGAGGGRGNGTQLPLLPARCAANWHRSEPTHARDRPEEG